jgi:undecaprenyl-diphosphatase
MEVDQITWKQAIKVGLFQCLSMWPGMSRSSSTIVGGWIGGLSTAAATEFSFFLAIPIMFGASLLKLVKFQMETGLQTLNSTEITSFGAGFAVAFLVALVCVKAFVNYLKKKPMKIFAYYRIGLSVLLAVLLITKVI